MEADPMFVDEGDLDAAREVVASAKDGELFLYPGDQHYFADSSLPSYDADAAALLTERVLEFLRTTGDVRLDWLPRVRHIAADGRSTIIATIEQMPGAR